MTGRQSLGRRLAALEERSRHGASGQRLLELRYRRLAEAEIDELLLLLIREARGPALRDDDRTRMAQLEALIDQSIPNPVGALSDEEIDQRLAQLEAMYGSTGEEA
jgi:hypothetical protein